MSNIRRILTACAVLVSATPLAAQQAMNSTLRPAATNARFSGAVAPAPTVAETPPAAATHEALGPTTSRSIAGVRVQHDAAANSPAAVAQSVSRNPALMIVGGTALIVGAVIGGDAGTIFMVSGAVVGLVGLWRYLQ